MYIYIFNIFISCPTTPKSTATFPIFSSSKGTQQFHRPTKMHRRWSRCRWFVVRPWCPTVLRLDTNGHLWPVLSWRFRNWPCLVQDHTEASRRLQAGSDICEFVCDMRLRYYQISFQYHSIYIFSGMLSPSKCVIKWLHDASCPWLIQIPRIQFCVVATPKSTARPHFVEHLQW